MSFRASIYLDVFFSNMMSTTEFYTLSLHDALPILSGLYAMALRPHLTFWLNVRPETAFGREFRKAQAISYWEADRKSTRLNSSHGYISYAVFCLKKKKSNELD